MKTLILILLLAGVVTAQDYQWKHLKELSGEVPNHPGITFQTYAAEIQRGGDRIRLIWKVEFPWGAPYDVFKDNVPWGFDPSSVAKFQARLDFNCATRNVKAVGGSGEIYQFNGKRHKTKEPPFTAPPANIFTLYFCEQGQAPTVAPTLKSKP
jgi:hypothetical protein